MMEMGGGRNAEKEGDAHSLPKGLESNQRAGDDTG